MSTSNENVNAMIGTDFIKTLDDEDRDYLRAAAEGESAQSESADDNGHPASVDDVIEAATVAAARLRGWSPGYLEKLREEAKPCACSPAGPCLAHYEGLSSTSAKHLRRRMGFRNGVAWQRRRGNPGRKT